MPMNLIGAGRVSVGRAGRSGRTTGGRTPALGTAMMLYITPGAPHDPTDTTWQPYGGLSGDIMVKGHGWEVWKRAVLNRNASRSADIVESTSSGYNTIAFNGEALIDLLSMQKIVFLGHAPPVDLVREIKRRSQIGTKVGIYFLNAESVSQAPDYNSILQPVADAQLAYLYATTLGQSGTGADAASHYVDYYQSTTSPGQAASPGTQESGKAPHVWLCEIESAELHEEWYTAVSTMLASRYGGDLDFALVDNVIAGLYYGTASTTQTDSGVRTEASYLAGQKAFWAYIQTQGGHLGQGAKLVGNCGYYVPTYYSTVEVPRRYCEHALHASQTSSNSTSEVWSTIITQLKASSNLKLIMPHCQIVGGGAGFTAGSYAASHVNAWVGRPNGPGGIYGSWTEMRDFAFANGLGDVIVPVAGRGGVSNAFGLHWHEGWMVPQ